MSMRITLAFLVLLFLALQYALWFSSGGLLQTWRMRDSIVQISEQNTALTARNTMLEADVQDLKQGNEAIEERARNDLGMVKQGETFYQISR